MIGPVPLLLSSDCLTAFVSYSRDSLRLCTLLYVDEISSDSRRLAEVEVDPAESRLSLRLLTALLAEVSAPLLDLELRRLPGAELIPEENGL